LAGTPFWDGCQLLLPEPEIFPRVQSVFQQLHNYPVGASGKEKATACKGNKYNITPVRREFLSDMRAVVILRGDADIDAEIPALWFQKLTSSSGNGIRD
jgi:CRISPR-associated protein Cas5t